MMDIIDPFPQRRGKSVFQEMMIREYIKNHPDAVIARISMHGVQIEKPVHGTHEIVRPARIEKK